MSQYPVPYQRPCRAVPYRRPDRHCLLEAGAAGAAVGYLFGRRHHPLVWVVILGGGAIVSLAVVALVVRAWPELAAATRWYRDGWILKAIGAGLGILAAWGGAVTVALVFSGPLIAAMAGALGLAVGTTSPAKVRTQP